MNAIPNSKPENAIINANGNNPKKKNINPEFIILYVNPLRIFKSIWPDNQKNNYLCLNTYIPLKGFTLFSFMYKDIEAWCNFKSLAALPIEG